MRSRLQQIRLQSRGNLHREMSVPALYIYGTDDPLTLQVRVHDKTSRTGDIPGLDTVEMLDVSTRIRFWRDEIPQPRRNAIISVAEGEAYRLGESFPHDGETVDVRVVRLDADEAEGLPLPSSCA